MTKTTGTWALIASAALIATPMAASATDARDLGYIRGMDSDDAERAMGDRDFDRVYVRRGGIGSVSYWWDGEDCVELRESYGSISSLRDVRDRECRARSGYGGSGSGGYQGAQNFDDLRGVRASSAMSALERRGFRQVDNFTSGNTRYSIQWNDRTRQCVQATIADGRIYDISDIGRHPNCRSGSSSPTYTAPRITWYRELAGDPAPIARQRLETAGFESVFIENGGQRTIYFNRASGQCLQMMARRRTVTSIRDIGSDRRCR